MRKSLMLALGILVLFSLSAVAKTKYTIKLHQPGTVNGAELKAGEYDVQFDNNQVVFLKGSREVARSAARLETEARKHENASVRFQGNVITQIRPQGKDVTLFLDSGEVVKKTEPPAEKKTPKSN